MLGKSIGLVRYLIGRYPEEYGDNDFILFKEYYYDCFSDMQCKTVRFNFSRDIDFMDLCDFTEENEFFVAGKLIFKFENNLDMLKFMDLLANALLFYDI